MGQGNRLIIIQFRYKVERENANERIVSYSRWNQYIHLYFPGLRLARSAEDVCDCCVRLDIQLQRDDLDDEERARLLMEKNTHLDAAIDQRRFVSNFVKTFVRQHDPLQPVPNLIIADHYDSERSDDIGNDDAVDASKNIQIQIEDFGGSFAMPHYGHSRPSADYFNSNLMVSNFVVADITGDCGDVIFYDERAQGKDANALCSLRFVYHVRKFQACRQQGRTPPKILVLVLDNCVGQNKSQVVMQFFALLSILFYEKVVCIYLIPGHSHNTADRIVAWCRNAMKGKNFFTPMAIVDAVNEVKGVNATLIDHRDPKRPCYSSWENVIRKNFKKLPIRYTFNYFFEFDRGLMSMRPLCSSPDTDAKNYPLISLDNLSLIRKSVLSDLYGAGIVTLEQALTVPLILPIIPPLTLPNKKLVSLGKKYFSIPPEFLEYYPALPADVRSQIDNNHSDEPTETREKRRQSDLLNSKEVPEDGAAAKNESWTSEEEQSQSSGLNPGINPEVFRQKMTISVFL